MNVNSQGAESVWRDQVALVAGGARVIGRATARVLAQRGAAVCVNYAVHADAAEELIAKIMAAVYWRLCTDIRASIGAKNLIPEEVNDTKITIRVAVMNKVQFLLASEPCKPLEARSL